jgi:hypothetical protein
MQDFLQGYYGAAWEPIWDHIVLLHDKVEKDNIHMHLYTNPAQGYLPDEVVAAAMALFDKAEAAVADDAELLERVRVCRMPLTYARLFPRNGYVIENGKLSFIGDRATVQEAQEFLDRMNAQGFKTIREVGGDPAQLMQFALAMSVPLDTASIGNEHLTVDVVPFLGGRALRIIERASGECVTAHNIPASLYFPFSGGDEVRLGGTFRPEGFATLYTVKDTTPTSITIAGEVDGFDVSRTFALAEGEAVLTITTVCANNTDKARQTRIRSHLELDLGELRQTRVTWTDRAGNPVEKDLEPVIAGMREGEQYYDQDIPDGAWVFRGSKNLQVTQRFDSGAIDSAWLYAFPETLNELETELWGKEVVVEPGASVTMTHTLEVVPATG